MSNAVSMSDIFKLKHIAVVGFSTNPSKPAHTVPKYLIEQGYVVYPVNPFAEGEILGRKVYKAIAEIPETVDVVCAFRPSEDIPQVLEDTLQRDDVKVFWMQLGITNEEAAARAQARGLVVVQDRCMYVEHRKLERSDS
ncbi:MAG: CoA-binding protein [Firmicutes bacterium]|jgi:predicted CoA-binding protein|nr:CoA-binding protein [Bacillota bacterium]